VRAPEFAECDHVPLLASMASPSPYCLGYLTDDSQRHVLTRVGSPNADRRDGVCCRSASRGANDHLAAAGWRCLTKRLTLRNEEKEI
jgi:hypothetical protein